METTMNETTVTETTDKETLEAATPEKRTSAKLYALVISPNKTLEEVTADSKRDLSKQLSVKTKEGWTVHGIYRGRKLSIQTKQVISF